MHTGNYDFLLERTLRAKDGDLHTRFTDTVFALQNILSRYTLLFPEYTNHSEFHCINVIEFCNAIIGPEQLGKLNPDELYVLLMSCYLHDTGMAISRKDYDEFRGNLDEKGYFELDPSRKISDFIRDYHHEFSGFFIRKYADILDVPSPEHLFAIIQTARGHRRTNLYDAEEYPSALQLSNGNTVCLPYLAALIRLADEVDIIAGRNPKLLYDIELLTDNKQIIRNKLLASVPDMEIMPDSFIIEVRTDDAELMVVVQEMAEKMQATLDLCRSVVRERTPFRISQERIEMRRV
ncbi:MAG: hypothetical protein IJS28_12215 [Synergistaceae bacterium]|nr:hypothetical protein [Synergistaceae bacterium]